MKTIKQLMDLNERTALITGGGGYLGRTFAETLLELGANIILIDIDKEKLDSAKEQLKKSKHQNIECFICDISNENAIQNTCGQIKENYSCLDIIINNAAYVGTTDIKGWAVPFEDQSSECWPDAIQVNLTSAFTITQSLAPLMKNSKQASVINIASIYGIIGPDMSLYKDMKMGNPAAYAASKGGLIQLTKWLATNLAPDIRVNSISPGGILRGQKETFVTRYNNKTPLGRMATEEDFKGIVAYLASDMSAYVTGQNFVIDGGWTCW